MDFPLAPSGAVLCMPSKKEFRQTGQSMDASILACINDQAAWRNDP
jgi:hypothetical protein